MKKISLKKCIGKMSIVFLVLGLIVCIIWGFCNEKNNFVSVNLYDLVSLYITFSIAIIGFYCSIKIVEGKNDLRRKKDKIDDEIIKLQELLQSNDLRLENYDGTEVSKKIVMNKISKLTNIICFIKKCLTGIDIENDFSAIETLLTKFSAVQDYLPPQPFDDQNKLRLQQNLDDIEQHFRNIREKLF